MNRFLLIGSATIHIPGDERSRAHPGHGYPARDEVVPTLKWFKDEDELLVFLSSDAGACLKDPDIYEICERVRVQRQTVVTLRKDQ